MMELRVKHHSIRSKSKHNNSHTTHANRTGRFVHIEFEVKRLLRFYFARLYDENERADRSGI